MVLKTLNVGHFPWADNNGPANLGTIGHQAATFAESCELAAAYSFDACNLHAGAFSTLAPTEVAELLRSHELQPGAFCFPIKLTDEVSESEFAASLDAFESEAPLAAEAGYTLCAHHILPFSSPRRGDPAPFHTHFRMVVDRLARTVPVLERYGLRAGIEPLSAFGLRRPHKHDFVHTIEGVRCMIAAAGAERCVGIKLDVFHMWASGSGLDELVKLDPAEVVYVELSDAVPAQGRWNHFSLPELHRELPGASGNLIDAPGVLAVLDHIGYSGPVVAEPFSRRLQRLPIAQAVAESSESLDRAIAAGRQYSLPPDLIGTHPYLDEPAVA